MFFEGMPNSQATVLALLGCALCICDCKSIVQFPVLYVSNVLVDLLPVNLVTEVDDMSRFEALYN